MNNDFWFEVDSAELGAKPQAEASATKRGLSVGGIPIKGDFHYLRFSYLEVDFTNQAILN